MVSGVLKTYTVVVLVCVTIDNMGQVTECGGVRVDVAMPKGVRWQPNLP